MEEVIITLEQEANEEVEIALTQEANEETIITLEQQESSDIVNRNYEALENLPSVNGVKLIRNKSFDDLGATSLSNIEIEKLINNIIL